MKTATLIFLAAITITIGIAGCRTAKKSPSPTTTSTQPPPVSTNDFLILPPSTGIYAPGDAELSAIKTQYTDATLDQLKTGYILYTEGACINCHKAKSIYNRDVEHWKLTIDKMAPMAKLSDTEKDAVYKYVMAIKARQPKK